MRCYCDAVSGLETFIRQKLADAFQNEHRCSDLSVEDDARGEKARNRFELVYSNGLLTTLDVETAQDTVRRAMDLVEPGGRLVVSNLSKGSRIRTCGLCAGLPLHRRTGEAIARLSATIPEEEVAGQVIYPDPGGVFLCLEIHKRPECLSGRPWRGPAEFCAARTPEAPGSRT